MLPCHNCAYRRAIPGNTHIQCVFNWFESRDARLNIPTNQGSERTNQWFLFPLNYDPGWGPNECISFSEEADPEKIKEPDPLAMLLALLR